jgi:hypothetical protein
VLKFFIADLMVQASTWWYKPALGGTRQHLVVQASTWNAGEMLSMG